MIFGIYDILITLRGKKKKVHNKLNERIAKFKINCCGDSFIHMDFAQESQWERR